MNPENPTVTVTIDNESVQAKRGSTILQVAREHEIYIPTLCYLPEVQAIGASRMDERHAHLDAMLEPK